MRPRATTSPAAIGIRSVVVPPQSTRIASARPRATSSALASQFAAATSSGRSRAASTGTSAPAVVNTRSSRPGSASCGRVEHGGHALALGREHVGQLGGRGQRDRRARHVEPLHDARDRRRQRAGVAPDLVRRGRDPRDPVVPHDGGLRVRPTDIQPDHHRRIPPCCGLVRVIPVIDIRGGIAVHARRGRREEYAPLQPTADPVAVATALCERAGSPTLYVADLDAIEHAEPNAAVLRALTAVADVWLDAGATRGPGVATARCVGTESHRGRRDAGRAQSSSASTCATAG